MCSGVLVRSGISMDRLGSGTGRGYSEAQCLLPDPNTTLLELSRGPVVNGIAVFSCNIFRQVNNILTKYFDQGPEFSNSEYFFVYYIKSSSVNCMLMYNYNCLNWQRTIITDRFKRMCENKWSVRCVVSVSEMQCVIAIESSDLFNGKLFKFGFENSETL